MDAPDRARREAPGFGAAQAAAAAGSQLAPVSLAEAAATRLGGLAVDPPARRLAHDDGREEVVQPKVMQVLVALIRAEGRIVSRDALFAACWPGVVVGEDALNRVIVQLRRLGAGIGADAFRLETIAKVGYRLTAAAPAAAGAPPQVQPAVRARSICVLPFANMSDDPQQAYFSDGVTEDIITDLGKVSSLFVVARTTAFAMRDRGLDIPSLAAELGVGHVLEGSVRKEAGRVRITAQLIDGASGGHLWAERYDRELCDIFALQDEISQAIVAALRLRLLPQERQAIAHRGTASLEAYELYLMARRYYVSGREGEIASLDAMMRLCRRATEIDPGYARAWALLAESQTTTCFTHDLHGEDGAPAIERALALDPDLAEAHAMKARHLMRQDRIAEAFAEIEIALRLDPESWAVNSEAGRLFYGERRFSEAIVHFEKATALGYASAGDPGMLLSSYHAIGDADGVLRAARKTAERAEQALSRDHVNGAAIGCGVGALAALGETTRARDLMARALLIDPDNPRMRYNFGCGAMAFLRDADLAIEMLAPVFETMTAAELAYVRIDPDLAALQGEPRFETLAAAAARRLAGIG